MTNELGQLEYDMNLSFYDGHKLVSFQDDSGTLEAEIDFDDHLYRFLHKDDRKVFNKFVFDYLVKNYPEIWRTAKYDEKNWYLPELQTGKDYEHCIVWLSKHASNFYLYKVEGYYVGGFSIMLKSTLDKIDELIKKRKSAKKDTAKYM